MHGTHQTQVHTHIGARNSTSNRAGVVYVSAKNASLRHHPNATSPAGRFVRYPQQPLAHVAAGGTSGSYYSRVSSPQVIGISGCAASPREPSPRVPLRPNVTASPPTMQRMSVRIEQQGAAIQHDMEQNVQIEGTHLVFKDPLPNKDRRLYLPGAYCVQIESAAPGCFSVYSGDFKYCCQCTFASSQEQAVQFLKRVQYLTRPRRNTPGRMIQVTQKRNPTSTRHRSDMCDTPGCVVKFLVAAEPECSSSSSSSSGGDSGGGGPHLASWLRKAVFHVRKELGGRTGTAPSYVCKSCGDYFCEQCVHPQRVQMEWRAYRHDQPQFVCRDCHARIATLAAVKQQCFDHTYALEADAAAVSTSPYVDAIPPALAPRTSGDGCFRDQYELGEIIGKGGFSSVHVANRRSTHHQYRYAVKCCVKTSMQARHLVALWNEVNILKHLTMTILPIQGSNQPPATR